jgi:hypothetical protein
MSSRRAAAAPPAWRSPGPVSSAFVDTAAPVSVLMGPAGGGKTITGLQRGVMAAFKWPQTSPGLRQVRFLVMRQRMTDMEGSTLPSWFRWYPRALGQFTGKEGSPKRHLLPLAHPDGGRIELDVHFRGIGDQHVDDALRGFEFSFAYVDECDLLDAETMATLIKRAGRFPPDTLALNPRQVWGTCNAPEPDNWVVTDLMDNPREGWLLFRQPSGLSAEAENLAVLGPDWYRNQAAVLPAYERRRFVENIPGVTRGEAAVYPEFNPDFHVAAAPLEVLPGRDLVVGADAGGTPAAALVQQAPDGQWRVLAELTTHEKTDGSLTGPNRFGETLAAVLAEPRFRGLAVRGIADPSAAYGADRVKGESSWIETVARVAGIRIWPAPTNDPTPRQEALRLPLGRLIDGRRAGFVIDPSCRLLARALARDYRFPVTAGKRGTEPLKNWASHLVEALQYALLDGAAYHQVMARRQRDQASLRPWRAQTDFNPFSQERRR